MDLQGRTRRAALGALALVVLSAGGTVACTQQETAAPARSPLPSSSSTITPTEPVDLDHVLALPTPPAVPGSVVQARWDPRTAGDLPTADIGLPASLDPPAGAAELVAVPSVAAMVEGPRELSLVDAEGRWWRLPLPEEPLPVPFYAPPTTRLTTDGTRVVFLGRTSLWSRDVRATRWRALDYPDGFLTPGVRPRRRRVPQVVPMAGAHVRLGRDRWWSVDLDARTFDPHPSPSGQVVRGADDVYVELGEEPDYDLTLLTWGPWATPEHAFRTDGLSTLSNIAADSASVAAVRGACWAGPPAPDGPSRRALVALDLDDLSARGYLPVRDPFGDYTCGSQLLPVGWVDADTVLLSAAAPPRSGADGWTLVTWDVTTGELRRVSATSTDRTYDIAIAVLGAGASP